MKVLLIDNGTTLLESLRVLIPGAEIVKKSSDVLPKDDAEVDLVILSGSSTSSVVFDGERFVNELALIRQTTKPVIGICFGCELLVYAFGGTLKELPVRHTGVRTITVLDHELFEQRQLQVYEHHRWIIDTVPNTFTVVATSEDGPEFVKHKALPIYGLQFHPEHMVDQTEGNEVFMELFNRINRLQG